MRLVRDTVLPPGIHALPDGIEIAADGVTLDGAGAVLVGSGREGVGVRVTGRTGVRIRNLTVLEYRHGIHAAGCRDLRIESVRVASTWEIPHNTLFLDIFHTPGAYPGAVLLEETSDSRVADCTLSHQMCGLLSYACRGLEVARNNASYSSGFGFLLSGTSESRFENNDADFCCRWHARAEGGGHMGADAAGFVLVNGSSRNTLQENRARLGGDGFFLAGLRHDGGFAPCDENLFVRNDASWSPNIGFEATFSSGNIFRENTAARCNYGFWLGFSRENLLEGNQIQANRQAGIAVENGVGMRVRSNHFSGNGAGVLLWSKRIPAFDAAVPQNDTSRDWVIEQNEFTANGKAIRIAADQDHGVRDFVQNGSCPEPHNHLLRGNRFDRNAVDVDAPARFLTSGTAGTA